MWSTVVQRTLPSLCGISKRALSLHLNSTASEVLSLKNAVTKQQEPLWKAGDNRPLTWYMCGPTVYDAAHLGHARTYVIFDTLRRTIEGVCNKPTAVVMGMTDVDDKILHRAQERDIAPLELARTYEKEFWKDMESLGVQPPLASTRVTEHMDVIQEYIGTLLSKRFAYVSEGSVWFDVHALEKAGYPYGRVGTPSINEGAQLLHGKHHLRDFALWRGRESESELLGWESPWGWGRPGWHIECSAMANAWFGPDGPDLHTGGIDLAFPHHCNEVAQCDAHNGALWPTKFVHSGHLHIQGCKMAKSLKNFVTIRDYLSEGSNAWEQAEVFRVFCLMHHYGSTIEFTKDQMQEAKSVRRRLLAALQHCKGEETRWIPSSMLVWHKLEEARNTFASCLQNDFDTRGALMALLQMGTIIQNTTLPVGLAFAVHRFFTTCLESLGIRTKHHDGGELWIDSLVEFRSQVRKVAASPPKVYEACDHVRDVVLREQNIQVEDKGSESVWKWME